jgi:tellurite resistance protein TehA-like permease
LFLGYAIPWSLVLGRAKRPVLAAANGTWFIWAVASQSVAVLAATLEPIFANGRRELAIIAVLSWSVGVVLYGVAGSFVAMRLLMYDVRAADVGQPYWVSMGATAITVLAGARIVEMADAPMVNATAGLVSGLAALFWCFGSWLIPALIAIGYWRHVIKKVPLRYEPPMWSMVFPLGMYGVASINIGQADKLPIVEAIGRIEIWLALAVWTIVFAGLLVHIVKSNTSRVN